MKKIKRKRSGKKILLCIFCLFVAMTWLCLGVCGGYAFYSIQRELQYCNEATVELYMDELNTTISALQNFTDETCVNDTSFAQLTMSPSLLTTEQKLSAEHSLRTLINNRISKTTTVYMFNEADTVSYFRIGDSFLSGVFQPSIISFMKQTRKDYIDMGVASMNMWLLRQSGGSNVLSYCASRRGMYICAMVDIDAFNASYPYSGRDGTMEFIFFNKNQILTNAVYAKEQGISHSDILASVNGSTPTYMGREMLLTQYNVSADIGVCGIVAVSGIRASVRVFTVLLIAALLMTTILFIAAYSITNKMLIYPLTEITDASRRIANGDSGLKDVDEPLQELAEIRSALGGLINQKITLEQDKMQEEYQKEHALLQYYQLQTRSHFFLNSLKSIYNLTTRGELEKTKRIITLFSNHIRYVFHDSLTCVSLRAEMREVDDYYHIIQLERETPLWVTTNVPEELMDFPVPPLAIEIFLENFNKCNVQGDKILRFSIKVDQTQLDNVDYVRIRMTDNGVGFSPEALKMLEKNDGIFEQYHVGIQNLRRRMEIIYGDRYQIAFFNNTGGGACSVIYLPSDAAKQGEIKA